MTAEQAQKEPVDPASVLDVVALGAPSVRIGASPAAVLESWRAAVGPPRHGADRLIVLPPLFANLGAGMALTPAQGPRRARGWWGRALREAARRPVRLAAVRFTYPEAPTRRLPLLSQHDRVHAVLRELIGAFARDTASVVIGGTALLDHPRTHWEAWPDTGNVFHGAWCFDPRGEPCGVARDPRAEHPLLRALAIDPAERSGSDVLTTPAGTVALAWQERRLTLPAAEMVWAPGLSAGGALPIRILLALPAGSARVAIRTTVDGLPLIAARRPSGAIEVARGIVERAEPEGVSWCLLRVAAPAIPCQGPVPSGD